MTQLTDKTKVALLAETKKFEQKIARVYRKRGFRGVFAYSSVWAKCAECGKTARVVDGVAFGFDGLCHHCKRPIQPMAVEAKPRRKRNKAAT